MIVCSYVRNSLAGRIGCAELVACSPGISLPLGSERGLKRGATLCPSSHPVLVESSAFGKGDRAMKVIGNLDEHTDGCWPALDPVSCHRGRGPFVFGTRPNLFQGCLPARRGGYPNRRGTQILPGQIHQGRAPSPTCPHRGHLKTGGRTFPSERMRCSIASSSSPPPFPETMFCARYQRASLLHSNPAPDQGNLTKSP